MARLPCAALTTALGFDRPTPAAGESYWSLLRAVQCELALDVHGPMGDGRGVVRAGGTCKYRVRQLCGAGSGLQIRFTSTGSGLQIRATIMQVVLASEQNVDTSE
jgi:hypothetical protein